MAAAVLGCGLWFRGLWALQLFLVLLAYRLGVPGTDFVQGFLAEFIDSIRPVFFGFWLTYVAGYLVAASLYPSRPVAACAVYFLAGLLDFALWLSASMFVSYEFILEGWAIALDIGFNLLDLALFAALLTAAVRRAEHPRG
ncbi:hypothetical protein [Maricaulis sp.]|uniref:hypothetical protein n=1 Tax=Maricaulis sp. TaxID=1486257 RepID=UPI002B272D6D|nr:hypothetical protein [Maricaulis sp.]